MTADRTPLLDALGVTLPEDLLTIALTHRSYAFENGGLPTNERLEFLGDAVLGYVVTDHLFKAFPALSEGDLARRRASIVSTHALAVVCRGLGVGPFIRLGEGEHRTGGADKDTRMVSPMPSASSAPKATEDLMVPMNFGPASVTPRCSG